jgi:hypothetical protein
MNSSRRRTDPPPAAPTRLALYRERPTLVFERRVRDQIPNSSRVPPLRHPERSRGTPDLFSLPRARGTALTGELCITGCWCWSYTRWHPLFLCHPDRSGGTPDLFPLPRPLSCGRGRANGAGEGALFRARFRVPPLPTGEYSYPAVRPGPPPHLVAFDRIGRTRDTISGYCSPLTAFVLGERSYSGGKWFASCAYLIVMTRCKAVVGCDTLICPVDGYLYVGER